MYVYGHSDVICVVDIHGIRTTRPLDNSPTIFKQLVPRSFIHYRAKRAAKYMDPRLDVIQIILRSFIHYRVWRSGVSCLGRIVQGANCPGGELSRGQVVWHSYPYIICPVSVLFRCIIMPCIFQCVSKLMGHQLAVYQARLKMLLEGASSSTICCSLNFRRQYRATLT